MKAIFITGTDTCVGKTVVTGLLGRYLLEKGYRVATQKWVQTGEQRDIDIHLEFLKNRDDFKPYYALMMPYSFKSAVSPHLAAKLENRHIDKKRIIKSLQTLSAHFDFVLIEGSGGVLVPFSSKEFLIDIVKELNLAVLVVAINKLGAINHTLLTIEACRAREIRILGVIFNNISKVSQKIVLKDNPLIVKRLSKEAVLGVLPAIKNHCRLQKIFMPLGDKIIARL